MIEDNFRTMVIMKSSDEIRNLKRTKKEEIFENYKKEETIIYRNIEVDSSEDNSLNIESFSISWEEKKKPLYNIDNLKDDRFIDECSHQLKLCKITIWKLKPYSKFVFIFFQNTSLGKSIEIINKFIGYNFYRVALDNSFFDKLINYNRDIDIVGKTVSIGINYRISLNSLSNKYEEPFSKEQITEVKFIIRSLRKINVRINNKGIVKILNGPSIGEAYEIVKMIDEILNKIDLAGELCNG